MVQSKGKKRRRTHEKIDYKRDAAEPLAWYIIGRIMLYASLLQNVGQ